jgi:hypothetical protein
MHFARLQEFAVENRWLLIFFPIFLAFQVYQSLHYNWDPYVYLLEGKWFCGERIYFEFLRAPLPGAVNCAFGAGELAPLLSAILASFLYLASLVLVYRKEEMGRKTSQFAFAALALLFPTILLNSNVGSDLYALSFLLIALSVPTNAKGLLFGLSTLSRYNFILYAPVFLLQIKGKGWLWFIAGFLLAWAPWLAFNYAQAGNPLFSVDEFLYLNIGMKGIAAPLGIEHAAAIIFFLASIYWAAGLDAKSAKDPYLLAGFIGILQFLFSGVKEMRFLDILVPVQALVLGGRFSASNAKQFLRLPLSGLAVVLAAAAIAVLLLMPAALGGHEKYSIPQDQKIRECRVMSDRWVDFYREGVVAEPLPLEIDFVDFLERGTSLVVYEKQVGMNESPEYEIINGQEYLFLKSKRCDPQPKSYVFKVWRGNA